MNRNAFADGARLSRTPFGVITALARLFAGFGGRKEVRRGRGRKKGEGERGKER